MNCRALRDILVS